MVEAVPFSIYRPFLPPMEEDAPLTFSRTKRRDLTASYGIKTYYFSGGQQVKGVKLEDTYQINLIVGFLLRFPGIFTINYDLGSLSYCFTFMIREKLSSDKYREFCKEMTEIWEGYCYLLKIEPAKVKIRKKYFSGLTRLDLFFSKDTLSSEEVSLINSVIEDRFGHKLVNDYRRENLGLFNEISQTDDDFLEFLLIQGEQKVNALFAFREAGKVYVLNK